MNFPLSHISSLCKYTGISFTAGAITHGFFSGERAIWTAHWRHAQAWVKRKRKTKSCWMRTVPLKKLALLPKLHSKQRNYFSVQNFLNDPKTCDYGRELVITSPNLIWRIPWPISIPTQSMCWRLNA